MMTATKHQRNTPVKKVARKTRRAARPEPLFTDVPVRKRKKGDLSKRIYSQLQPSNPHAKYDFANALGLLVTRQLAQAVRQMEDADNILIVAVELLEQRGVRQGIHFRDLAVAIGRAPVTAKRKMLQAEFLLYETFGLTFAFIDNNGVWKLATDRERASKYAQMTKGAQRQKKRAEMYQSSARKHGKRDGQVVLPLFTLEID